MTARARSSKGARSSGGRRRGQTSAAIAKSARANGEKGGRPRDRVPDEVLTRLGAPPSTAKELRLWNARLIAEVLVLSMRGEVGGELAATIRTTATALDRALPREVGEDDAPLDELEEDDEARGPDLEDDAGDAEPLRVG